MFPTQDIEINTLKYVISFTFIYIFITMVAFGVFFAFIQYLYPRKNAFNNLIEIKNSALL